MGRACALCHRVAKALKPGRIHRDDAVDTAPQKRQGHFYEAEDVAFAVCDPNHFCVSNCFLVQESVPKFWTHSVPILPVIPGRLGRCRLVHGAARSCDLSQMTAPFLVLDGLVWLAEATNHLGTATTTAG